LDSGNNIQSGAYKVFEDMFPSSFEDWRSPNRVLEVTICKVWYPITEMVLHLVFAPFGEVEVVHVLEESDPVFAQVIFHSKHVAADAFGDLHGQNI
jgi:hypothetical protein